MVRSARAAPGCIDFTLGQTSSNQLESNVYERWATEQQLHDFRGSGPDSEQTAAIIAADVREFTTLDA